MQELPGLDYVCDFWELPSKVKGKYDEIHMTHVLEHFPMKDTVRALQLVHFLLKDKGRLYLEVPNFLWQAQVLVENPDNRKIVEYAYGGQLNEWDFHYNGFTPQILRVDLLDADFKVEELRPESSILCYAIAT